MPRLKPVHKGLQRLPVDFERQRIPGSFEHALSDLVDHALDLSALERRYRHDFQGAAADAPAVLLKIILLAYSRGIVGSRQIDAACRENVLFMALSGDSQPHFTPLAAFVSGLGDMAAQRFGQVLLICDRQGLIGREMVAIDGVTLPSNASKAKSGTRKDFRRQAEQMEKAARQMLARHHSEDAAPQGAWEAERDARTLERLQREAKPRRQWLEVNQHDRQGARGQGRLSHRTDNQSAKLATGKGVIQGDTGVAAVDEKAQIVIDAQAHGTGSAQDLLTPVVEATAPDRTAETIITADSGYHAEANLNALSAQDIDASLPDNGSRKRDARDAEQDRHKAKPDSLHDKTPNTMKPRLFTPEDFDFDPEQHTCYCPAGKRLYRSGAHGTLGGFKTSRLKGAIQDGAPCLLRTQCLRTPDKTRIRQVAFFRGKAPGQDSHTDRMKRRIDSATGTQMITRRFATVEPVFGNLRSNKRLDRCTLRGRGTVDGPWTLYGLTHNIEKLAHHGYAA